MNILVLLFGRGSKARVPAKAPRTHDQIVRDVYPCCLKWKRELDMEVERARDIRIINPLMTVEALDQINAHSVRVNRIYRHMQRLLEVQRRAQRRSMGRVC